MQQQRCSKNFVTKETNTECPGASEVQIGLNYIIFKYIKYHQGCLLQDVQGNCDSALMRPNVLCKEKNRSCKAKTHSLIF